MILGTHNPATGGLLLWWLRPPAWGKMYGKSWIDKLPLPKYHAKKHNKTYKENNNAKYLMLDYYDK